MDFEIELVVNVVWTNKILRDLYSSTFVSLPLTCDYCPSIMGFFSPKKPT